MWGQDASCGASCCFVRPPVHPGLLQIRTSCIQKRVKSSLLHRSWHDADSLLLNKVIVCLRCVFSFLRSLSLCYCKIFPPLFTSHAFSLPPLCLYDDACLLLECAAEHWPTVKHTWVCPTIWWMTLRLAVGSIRRVCVWACTRQNMLGGWERWGRILLSWKSH